MDEVGATESARITVLAAGWALRRPALAAAFQRFTAGDRNEAYLLSRVLLPSEAEELTALGWTPADLQRLVRFERPRKLVPNPVAVTGENPDPDAPLRRWYPPANRPDLPRRNELPFGELVKWARLRPSDRPWLTGITVTELRWLGLPRIMEVLAPYLTSSLGIDCHTAFAQARRYVPFTLFESVVKARGSYDPGLSQEWIDSVLGGRWIHQVPEWESVGWISHPAQAALLFVPAEGADPSARWERWSAVARRTGPDGLHPAEWWAAGFSPEEALRAFEKGRIPDRATLEAMAVVRGKTRAGGSRPKTQ